MRRPTVTRALVCGLLLALSAEVRAQGFQLERYEPTPAGSWTFAVVNPWYSSTRYFAGGLTLDYGHNALLGGVFDANGNFRQLNAIVEHALVGHIDLAGSFLDRVLVSASLPVVLTEQGTPAFGVAPLSGAAVGDPRLGIHVRLWGQPERGPISIHLGGYLWIPIGAQINHAGEQTARGMPQIILSGLAARRIRWAFNGGVLIRAQSQLGFGPASRIGSELQLGAAIAYADTARRFSVGPELTFGTFLVGGNAFQRNASNLELLVGGQYNIAKQVQVGLAVGSGLVGVLGTPDARLIFRVAYAPIRELAKPAPLDSDGDGIADDVDACPHERGLGTATPRTHGCPDADRDGIIDAEDLCPGQAIGARPDPKMKGCPVRDADNDGVADADDLCPGKASGDKPDPKRPGCPLEDSDGDATLDDIDQCPTVPAGANPDPARPGCPKPDTDGDGIFDDVDACKDVPGIADPDPKQHGCPKLEIRRGQSTELRMVNFETNKATLLPESFPVLDAVAKILKENQQFRRVIIEGHADDTGTAAWNLRLSKQRARAVVDYLAAHGVRRGRLEYVGYGDTRPLVKETSDEGRARNRRVEVKIPEAEK